MKVVCSNCDSEFDVPPSRSDAKFCSMQCRSDYSSVELVCSECDNTFSVQEHKSDREYCSPECQYSSMEKEYETISCGLCGDEFDVKPSVADDRRFCSRECLGSATRPNREKKKVSVECDVCSDKFEVWPYRVESVKTCSLDCRAEYMSDIMRELDNPDIRKTREYRKWREAVFDKCNSCAECGATSSLNAHHIVPISEDESMATDVDNGKLLCVDCHAQKHPEIEELIRRNVYDDTDTTD